MKVVIYCRVSTSDQNCEHQLAELRDYVARRGWINAKEYVDHGFSGGKGSRPALDRLMADAARRKFDLVVVWKIDRFGRSVLHLNQQIGALTAHGVRFIATSQALDTDESNPASRLLLQVLAAVAEFEKDIIKERTLLGVRAAKAKGKGVGRPMRVFRRDQIIKLREQGVSWRGIAERLGVPLSTVTDAYRRMSESAA